MLSKRLRRTFGVGSFALLSCNPLHAEPPFREIKTTSLTLAGDLRQPSPTVETGGSQAARVSDFVGSLGVNVHMTYTNTSYGNVSMVESDLAYLGINQIRDGVVQYSGQLGPYNQLAAAGIKFDFLLPGGTVNLPSYIQELDSFEQAHAGSIIAVEGPNEVNFNPVTYQGQTGLAAAAAYQQAIFAAVKSDPNLAGVPVYGLTLGGVGASAYVPLGNLSSAVTDGNMHVYYPNGTPPAPTLTWALQNLTGDTPGAPMVMTETNYYTMPDGGNGVNQDVQAKYDLDLLMDATSDGIKKTYLYELLDENPDPNNTDFNQHFGLFNSDGSPKEAATAIHNLTAILADTGATATTFSPGPLNYSVSGLPSMGNSLLLEKSNGAFDIVVWNEPEIWKRVTKSQTALVSPNVIVGLGTRSREIEVFDPRLGRLPIKSFGRASQAEFPLPDHPVVVEVRGEPTEVGAHGEDSAHSHPGRTNTIPMDR